MVRDPSPLMLASSLAQKFTQAGCEPFHTAAPLWARPAQYQTDHLPGRQAHKGVSIL